ncbi:acyltransferase family protein [Fodinicola feengrottensis]|uniref:acyltransferase family protein n=1 Tax=Fodinicola feengrottensis TaxID=435914 RepID=UPI0013CFF4DC|nr:acyltransferase family protein [Fodinicola feengrottensis]
MPVIDFPSAAFLPQYVGLFVVGLLASRRGWLTTPRRGMGRIGGVAALIGMVVYLAMLIGGHGSGGPSVQAFVAALAEAVYCVGICLALLSLFRRTARKEGAFGRYLSQHAFTVYVIHAPLVVGVTIAMHALVPTDLALVNFALAAVIAVPLSFALVPSPQASVRSRGSLTGIVFGQGLTDERTG